MTNEDKILKRLCGNIAAGRFNGQNTVHRNLTSVGKLCQ